VYRCAKFKFGHVMVKLGIDYNNYDDQLYCIQLVSKTQVNLTKCDKCAVRGTDGTWTQYGNKTYCKDCTKTLTY
jgi:hypothetical protein